MGCHRRKAKVNWFYFHGVGTFILDGMNVSFLVGYGGDVFCFGEWSFFWLSVCVCGCVVYLLFWVMVENGEEEEKSEGTFELVKKKKMDFWLLWMLSLLILVGWKCWFWVGKAKW
jgi:hypothetical protein